MSKQAYQSIADFYRDPASPYAGFAQEHRSGGSMPIRMARAVQHNVNTTDPAVPELILTLSQRSAPGFRWDLGYGASENVPIRPGDICLTPPNTSAYFDLPGTHDVLFIAVCSSAFASILEDHQMGGFARLDSLTELNMFRDEPIRRVMMQLWTESARAGGTSDLLIDGLTQVLIARLLDKAGALARPVQVPKLSGDEIARLDLLIADQLDERITVETLARALDMPRWTFADAFKATTGETPHAYVTARRLDRACDLLRLGDLPLAEVAYATGFASQSHMTDTFRRCLDTTPGAWRREVRK